MSQRFDGPVVLKTECDSLGKKISGKVRDIYDLGEHLLLVATDRISAFDVVLPQGIPGKGYLQEFLPPYLCGAPCPIRWKGSVKIQEW